MSFDVPSHSIFGLLGPNGAGKTTLFSIIADFLKADAGRIEVLGIDINTVPYHHLRDALEELFRLLAKVTRETVTPKAYREMIFEHVMTYVKRDIKRLQTYAILDDVVRYLF